MVGGLRIKKGRRGEKRKVCEEVKEGEENEVGKGKNKYRSTREGGRDR
jgi:hypothetical protein